MGVSPDSKTPKMPKHHKIEKVENRIDQHSPQPLGTIVCIWLDRSIQPTAVRMDFRPCDHPYSPLTTYLPPLRPWKSPNYPSDRGTRCFLDEHIPSVLCSDSTHPALQEPWHPAQGILENRPAASLASAFLHPVCPKGHVTLRR